MYFEIHVTCHGFLFLADAINSLLVLYRSCCYWLRCMAKPKADFFSLVHYNSEIFPSASARCLYTRGNLWAILDALSFLRCCSGFRVYWGRFSLNNLYDNLMPQKKKEREKKNLNATIIYFFPFVLVHSIVQNRTFWWTNSLGSAGVLRWEGFWSPYFDPRLFVTGFCGAVVDISCGLHEAWCHWWVLCGWSCISRGGASKKDTRDLVKERVCDIWF